MLLLDRHIIRRYLANFAILFVLVYLLATSIDIILQVDEFTQAVEETVGADAGRWVTMKTFASLVLDFHGPRIFQLFAYLLGLTSVGAMGFTLAQMMRHGELVALLSSGMSLYRVAWPIIVATFLLNIVHLVNSNLVLPMFASDLIRSHSEMGPGSAHGFDIPFTADERGALLHAPSFDRHTGVLDRPTIIERDEDGKALRRITADSAAWNEAAQAWMLENGRALLPARGGQGGAGGDDVERDLVRSEPVEMFPTDLSPRVLLVRQYAEFAQMLSPAQIEELIATSGAVDVNDLARIRYGRYAIILTNILMLMIALPFFLMRQPAGLLTRSMMCAGASLSSMMGAFIGMEADIEALTPAFSVFFPVIVLIPIALAAMTFIRT